MKGIHICAICAIKNPEEPRPTYSFERNEYYSISKTTRKADCIVKHCSEETSNSKTCANFRTKKVYKV